MKIIRFSAIWCMYCLYMKTQWEEIEKIFPEIKYFEYDADNNHEEHQKYTIKDIPTVIFLNDLNEEIFRLEGVHDKDNIIKKILELKKLI